MTLFKFRRQKAEGQGRAVPGAWCLGTALHVQGCFFPGTRTRYKELISPLIPQSPIFYKLALPGGPINLLGQGHGFCQTMRSSKGSIFFLGFMSFDDTILGPAKRRPEGRPFIISYLLNTYTLLSLHLCSIKRTASSAIHRISGQRGSPGAGPAVLQPPPPPPPPPPRSTPELRRTTP